MFYLDSCTCITFLRGKAPLIRALLKANDPKLFGIPAIVEAELRVGAEKSINPRKMHYLVDQFLLPFEIIPFDAACAYTYGKIRATLERQGNRIGHNDLLIAATALTHNAVLVTSNTKEFVRVPGLAVEDWEEIDI